LCIFNPVSAELILLTKSSFGISLSRKFPLLDVPVTGLVPIQFSKVQPAKHKRKKYDPIAAQIGELLNRSTVSAREQFQDLRRAWRERFKQEPPDEITLFDTALDNIIADLSFSRRDLSSEQFDKSRLGESVSFAAGAIHSLSEGCSKLRRQLDDYAQPPDLWTQSVSYGDLARPCFLGAANRFAEELVKRAGFFNSPNIISVLGESFALASLANSIESLAHIPQSSPSLHILYLPSQLKLRFGSLPVLAHEIGHIFFKDGSNHATELLARMYSGRLEIFRELTNELDRTVTKYEGNRIDQSNFERQRLRVKRATIGFAWMTEILCDLIACALSGPSYLYSISRFVTGTFSEFVGERRFTETHPSFVERVILCIEFLKSTGFEVSFVSDYLDSSRLAFPTDLAQEISSLVKQPYSCREHSRAVGEVKQRLMEGRPVKESPILILNALWDGVMRNGDYVNEIAVVVSLLDSYSE